MKLVTLFLIAACLQIYGNGAAQITISKKNLSLESVIKMVKKQSGYALVFDIELVRQKGNPVSINIKNASVNDALTQIFKNQVLDYEITPQHLILIKEKIIHPNSGLSEIAQPPASPKPALINVRGTVKDEAGQPIVRASVNVKGTSTGTYTNEQGAFSLNNINENATLSISSTSTEPAEVKVNGRTTLNITVKIKITEIDDVVVTVNTGYQRLQPHQMTGAATTLSQKKYDQRVAVTGNFLESLEGKLPGLVYNSKSGELSIRGESTFDAVKQPLIIVDGFPTEIDLRTINPIDIVSVTVLRDASASSIYGVRASNGVIVIETRRGSSGKAIVNFRATTAIQNKPDFGYLNYAPASEFVETEKTITSNSPTSLLTQADLLGRPLSPVGYILRDKVNGVITEDEANRRIAAVGSYDNLNEYENLFYQNRLANNLNLDVSGGSDKYTYMLGFNYVGEKLAERRAKDNRYQLNLANTFKFSKKIKFDFKANFTNSKNSKGGAVPSYASFFPYEHLADSAGNALPTAFGLLGGKKDNSLHGIISKTNDKIISQGLYDKFYYPYRELLANTTTTKTSAFRLQGRFNFELTPWMNMDIGGTFENEDTKIENFIDETAYYTRLLLNVSASKSATTGKAIFQNIPQGNILKRTSQKQVSYTLRGQLNINKYFNKREHYIAAIIGLEQRKIAKDLFATTYFGYDGQTLLSKPINLIEFGALGSTNTSFPDFRFGSIDHRYTNFYNQTYGDNRFMSYYGNATYELKEKYIATGSVRLDQSNLFGADPKYRNKPLWSAGLAWRVIKEDFMKNQSFIDDLKLRFSTGFTGNIPSSNSGKFLILNSGLNTIPAVPQSYYGVSNPKNESLRWETTVNYNAGIDFALLKYRLSGTVDYYIKKSTDVFGTFGADPTSGFNDYKANTASILNKGFEILLNTINIRRKNFQWSTQLTASFNHNKVLKIKESSYTSSVDLAGGTKNLEGKPINALYSYNYGGLTNLGQPFALTQKGEKVILSIPGTDVARTDMIYSGTITPKHVIGFNNQFSFGPVDLSFLIMYYGGHVMRVEQPHVRPTASLSMDNILKGTSNYWKQPGDELTTLIPALPKNSASATGYYSVYAPYAYLWANQFVRKANYLRLRDVVITYNINSKALNKIGFDKPQVRLQAQNLYRYTFSGNDIDPDAISRSSGVRSLATQPLYSLSFFTKF